MREKHHKIDNDTLKERVMESITQKKVAPKPRWYFTIKNCLLWATGTGLLLVGAFSVSIIIFIVTGNGWELRQIIGSSSLGYLVQVFPYLWLIAFIVFLITAEYFLTHTKGAYKHSPLKISLAIIGASIILGIIIHACKITKHADSVLGKHAPQIYKTLDQRRDGLLDHPERGRVMGIVQSVDLSGNPQTFVIMHPRKKREMTIYIDQIPQEKFTLIQVGEELLIVGKPKEKGIFSALDIHPIEKFKKRIRKMINKRHQSGESFVHFTSIEQR